MKQGDPQPEIRTRRVHYIAGFDPRGVGSYYRLFREEAAKQSRHNQAEIAVQDRERREGCSTKWRATANWNGRRVATVFHFMHWDDLVRRWWTKGLRRLLAKGVLDYLQLVRCGALRQVRKFSSGAFYTSIFPLVYLAAVLVASLGSSFFAAWLSVYWSGELWVGAIVLSAAIWASCSLGMRKADQSGALWVLQTIVFICDWARSSLFSDMQARTEAFAREILKAQEDEPADEVLIVSHSVGAMVAIETAAKLIEYDRAGSFLPGIHFLTLGQCLPYLGVMPGADAFRENLRRVGSEPRLAWSDVTAPPDPLCFYKVNPLAASGLPHTSGNGPALFTMRIFRMFTRKTYRKLRRDKKRLHFQYLMASELPANYDYFKITLGPWKLEEALADLPKES